MRATERKQQILDAALGAFAEHGYERTSIAIICEKAGIARPTLYQYFKDKRSVFRELLENYLIGMHEKLHERQQARVGKKELSPREKMQSIHNELLEEFVNNRNLYTILFKEAKARNAETEDIVSGLMQGMTRKLVNEFREYPVSETLGEKDMEFMVMYMLGGLMQTVEYYLFNDDNTLSTQEIADKITFIESRIKGI
jgi:AcrR family transcriptional regulator